METTEMTSSDHHTAVKFIINLAEEELQFVPVGTGAEVALRHIARRAKELAADIERDANERKNCPPVSESEYVRRLEADVARLETHPDYIETRNKVAAAREAQMKKLRALVADLRQRSVEEGIHHFVKLIDEGQPDGH
jgi:hypothetical protein